LPLIWASLDGKHPFAFARADREPMAFAGLWEGWKAEGTGKVLRTSAIITTPANATAAAVHDRMPVVLERDNWATWLGEAAGDPARLLRPARDGLLDAWAVSCAVNLRAEWGSVDRQVLEIERHKTLSSIWAAYGLESVVTWTLTPTSAGTHLRMEQSGFRTDQQPAHQGTKHGCRQFFMKLDQVLARTD
jgi:uncharacterized protein YndB with AHSA1/START domain